MDLCRGERRVHPPADDAARVAGGVRRPRRADPARARPAPPRVHRQHAARPPEGTVAGTLPHLTAGNPTTRGAARAGRFGDLPPPPGYLPAELSVNSTWGRGGPAGPRPP